MRTFKSVFGVVGALVPILYCGGLLYYFFDVGGSVQGAEDIGLGPTLLGLGVLSLLFCIPLILKLVRIFTAARTPGSGPDTPGQDDEGGFEADAAIARYMARRSPEAAPGSPTVPPPRGGPAKRSGFGRRGG